MSIPGTPELSRGVVGFLGSKPGTSELSRGVLGFLGGSKPGTPELDPTKTTSSTFP